MNKQQLSELLGRCSPDSPLFPAAQEAVKRLQASNSHRISFSGEPEDREALLRIYSVRLKLSHQRKQHMLGLEETVQMFARGQGPLRSGYAETDAHLIYFWIDDAGNLAGCIP